MTAEDLLEKDYAENVMIVDLVRNDLGRVAEVGSVSVPRSVRGRGASRAGAPGLHRAGAAGAGARLAGAVRRDVPAGLGDRRAEVSALRIIDELEPEPRGPYCGAVGWVDADRRRAALAVGIRTFWVSHDEIRFGTGAGITWGSPIRGASGARPS